MTIWGGSRVDLSKFKRGWLLLGTDTAHHYDRTDTGFVSACGRQFNPAMRDKGGFVAFAPGGFPKCKRCQMTVT